MPVNKSEYLKQKAWYRKLFDMRAGLIDYRQLYGRLSPASKAAIERAIQVTGEELTKEASKLRELQEQL